MINNSLKKYFKISHPRIALLGLNPHSGEKESFGDEEKKIFEPVLAQLEKEKIDINGPFPSDTFFAGNYQAYDIIVSAYHDQGLIPFKMVAFDTGVNVTLGLPFIRTSVDHGTAFDIAGQGKSSSMSLKNALNFAEKMLE